MPLTHIYRRYQPAVVPDHSPDSQAYWFIFRAGQMLVHKSGQSASLPSAAGTEAFGLAPVRTQYLGILEGRPCYSAEVGPDAEEPAGMTFYGLRALYGSIDEDLFYLAGRAFQITAWDRNHQFCGRCGEPTITVEHERAKRCPSCGLTSYPRLSPAVITAILRPGQILLAHSHKFTGNMYSLIAGFAEPGESLEECVEREIMEEVGIKVKNIRYFGSQPWPFPDSLMVGYIADYESGEIQVDGKELAAADWFDLHSLPELPSPVSIARKIIDWVVREEPAPR